MDRRKFFKSTGVLAGAGLLGSEFLQSCAHSLSGSNLTNFGLQLWTVKNVLAWDPKLVIKKIGEHGYNQIESFDGGKSIFWGMSPQEFKSVCDGAGVAPISAHCNIDKDFEKLAADAASIGMKYLICPYLGKQPALDDYKRAADKFNDRGETCRKNGLRFAYHNHDYAFKLQDGQFPQDIMMSHTNKDLVDFEMDMYWVVTAGQDPVKWFKKYPNRFRLGHVKDRLKGAAPDEGNASTILGTGSIDYPQMLRSARKYGMQYFIVEQERYDDVSELGAAYRDALYMKSIKI